MVTMCVTVLSLFAERDWEKRKDNRRDQNSKRPGIKPLLESRTGL